MFINNEFVYANKCFWCTAAFLLSLFGAICWMRPWGGVLSWEPCQNWAKQKKDERKGENNWKIGLDKKMKERKKIIGKQGWTKNMMREENKIIEKLGQPRKGQKKGWEKGIKIIEKTGSAKKRIKRMRKKDKNNWRKKTEPGKKKKKNDWLGGQKRRNIIVPLVE